MMRLGKDQPSLEISAFKIRVSESRARYMLNRLEVSNFYNLISESRKLHPILARSSQFHEQAKQVLSLFLFAATHNQHVMNENIRTYLS